MCFLIFSTRAQLCALWYDSYSCGALYYSSLKVEDIPVENPPHLVIPQLYSQTRTTQVMNKLLVSNNLSGVVCTWLFIIYWYIKIDTCIICWFIVHCKAEGCNKLKSRHSDAPDQLHDYCSLACLKADYLARSQKKYSGRPKAEREFIQALKMSQRHLSMTEPFQVGGGSSSDNR